MTLKEARKILTKANYECFGSTVTIRKVDYLRIERPFISVDYLLVTNGEVSDEAVKQLASK